MTAITDNLHDINRYDRMIRTYGIDASKLLQSGTLYIIGLKRGFAGEICKNLALSGINTINLVGDELIDMDDICFHIYNKDNIGKYCSYILKDYIEELNSMVKVNIINSLDTLIPKSVVVVINNTIEKTSKINIQCRLNNCKMVYLLSSGLAGSIFVDVTDDHIVMDTHGENKDLVLINDITSEGVIHTQKHNFNIGDIVKFNNININSLYFTNQNWKVTNTTKYNFTIVSVIDNMFILPKDFKFINGSIIYVMVPTLFKHNMLKDSLPTENVNNIPYYLDKVLTMQNNTNIELNKYLYTKDLHIEPVISLMCGFTSSEIIKLLGYKYTPISQWFSWSDHNIFSQYDSIDSIKKQYDIILDKMKQVNIMLVGCGALGCEWLKNLSMLGCSNIDIIDPDHIEQSNLSRQFLFRPSDVGKSKCIAAINKINSINPNIKLTAHITELGSNTEFSDEIFNNKHVIINALDNIKARRFVDMKCFDKTLPLFESGTMGMKGNTMPIIPYLTETYCNMNETDDTTQFPVCTIKNFPNIIQHTIHWARDNFELYNRGPNNCNRYCENPNYLDTLSPIDRNQAIDDINYFLLNSPSNWKDCIHIAKKNFEELFIHNIMQLLHNYPQDHLINVGNSTQLFWSHGKVCPIILTMKDSIDFIDSMAHILCNIYVYPFCGFWACAEC